MMKYLEMNTTMCVRVCTTHLWQKLSVNVIFPNTFFSYNSHFTNKEIQILIKTLRMEEKILDVK